MAKPVINHERYVPALLNFLSNKLASGASSAYRREFGVGVTEWRILSLLAGEDGCSAQYISQYFDLDKGLVSRTIRSLVNNGCVTVLEQTADIKRSIALTKAGRALHDRIIELALDREQVLIECLAPAEVDALIDMLRRLLARTPAVNAVQVRKVGVKPAVKRARSA